MEWKMPTLSLASAQLSKALGKGTTNSRALQRIFPPSAQQKPPTAATTRTKRSAAQADEGASHAEVWLSRMKRLKLYIDGIDDEKRQELKSTLEQYGATLMPSVEGSTHMVLGENPDSEKREKDTETAAVNSVKIWQMSKLESILAFLSSQRKDSLANAFERERVYGVPTNKTTQTFVPFKGKFLLVEEKNFNYKPVLAKEYELNADGTWPMFPKIHTRTKCPFVLAPDTSSDEKLDESEIKERIGKPTSTASGFMSNSAMTLVKRDQVKGVSMDKFESRAFVTGKKEKQQAAKKKKADTGLSFYYKGGYCENCGVEYQKFCEHIRTIQHLTWAKLDANFRTIDSFIDSLSTRNLEFSNWYNECDEDHLDLLQDEEEENIKHVGTQTTTAAGLIEECGYCGGDAECSHVREFTSLFQKFMASRTGMSYLAATWRVLNQLSANENFEEHNQMWVSGDYSFRLAQVALYQCRKLKTNLLPEYKRVAGSDFAAIDQFMDGALQSDIMGYLIDQKIEETTISTDSENPFIPHSEQECNQGNLVETLRSSKRKRTAAESSPQKQQRVTSPRVERLATPKKQQQRVTTPVVSRQASADSARRRSVRLFLKN